MSLFAFAVGMPGPMELAIIGGILILIFGPKQLPKMFRSLGAAIPSLQRGMAETKAEIAELDRAAAEAKAQAEEAVQTVVDAAHGKETETPKAETAAV
jgi:sec-independent protein translocase protein TatA